MLSGHKLFRNLQFTRATSVTVGDCGRVVGRDKSLYWHAGRPRAYSVSSTILHSFHVTYCTTQRCCK